MVRPRKTTNPSNEINEMLKVEPLITIDEGARDIGCEPEQLQAMFAEALGDETALTWETIPTDKRILLKQFKAELQNITAMAEADEVPASLVNESPLVQDEPEAPKAKKSKRQSSALTKKKTEAIAQGRAASQQTNQGVKQVLAKLQAQEGIKDAANAGTTYLQAFQATLNQVKGEGLTVLAAEMLQGLSGESDFTPDEILSELGVNLSTETQQALLGKLTPVLGKSEEATQEILATAWGNGIDLDTELSQLTNLLNSED